MPFCEYCGDEIGYLPFKCKYCGGTYCKKHRLPENHECTFENKHTPVIPTTRRRREKEPPSKFITIEDSKKIKRFLKKQEKKRQRARKVYDNGYGFQSRQTYITYLLVMIFIFSITAIIVPQYVCLSYLSYFEFYLWTFVTSLFVSYSPSLFGIFLLFIYILFFYNIIKLIELRFGSKFLIGLYLLSAGFTGVLFTLLFLPLQPLYPYPLPIFGGLAYGGLLGIVSFLIYFNFDRRMTMIIIFIPVRLKGKSILLLLILLRLGPGLLFGLIDPLYFIVYLPDLGGILASWLLFRYKFRYSRSY